MTSTCFLLPPIECFFILGDLQSRQKNDKKKEIKAENVNKRQGGDVSSRNLEPVGGSVSHKGFKQLCLARKQFRLHRTRQITFPRISFILFEGPAQCNYFSHDCIRPEVPFGTKKSVLKRLEGLPQQISGFTTIHESHDGKNEKH